MHQASVVRNDIVETRDLCPYADDRGSLGIREELLYQILSHALVNERVIAQDDTVIIVDRRKFQDTLKTDDVERITGCNGACCKHIDLMPLLFGIVIEALNDRQRIVSVHVSNKHTDLHIK